MPLHQASSLAFLNLPAHIGRVVFQSVTPSPSRLMPYRCIFTNGDDSETVTDIDAVDDADALLKSEVILVDGDYTSLEVWLEDRIVGYRLQTNRVADNAHELWILCACLVGIAAFFALTMAVVLGAI